MKKIYRAVSFICMTVDAALVFLLVCLVYYNIKLPESYTVTQSEQIYLDTSISMRADNRVIGESTRADMYFWGAIPVKSVSVSTAERKVLTVSGAPFGVRMLTEGLMVIGISDVYTEAGTENPAKKAGLKVGDIITAVDGATLKSSENLTAALDKKGTTPAELTVNRGGTELKLKISAVLSSSDKHYRLGVWLRDSSAGIGILTFVDKNSLSFGGLGHPVCDADIGDILPLRSGEIMKTVILGYRKGEKGSPGELRGRFEGIEPLGKIQVNSTTGVYGKLLDYGYKGTDMPIAYTDEIHTGNATILTTIDGDTPSEYSVVIERVNTDGNSPQNMVIRVTDPKLIETTGGIVQGMSGSPIIQDGRLVGAVTHVLVNDPTKGYGVFIENMLKNIDTVYNKKAA